MRIAKSQVLGPTRHSVLIVDDHVVVRQGVRATLVPEADLEVCGEVSSLQDALAAARSLQPHLILLDLTLPDSQGTQAIATLREAAPSAKIVILSMHDQVEIARGAIRAGASAYVLKSNATAELAVAIRSVMRGTPFISGTFGSELLAYFLNPNSMPQPDLTAKEREVVILLARGKKNREIASHMGISARTVESHRYRVMRKLKLGSLSDLVRFALRHQLVEL